MTSRTQQLRDQINVCGSCKEPLDSAPPSIATSTTGAKEAPSCPLHNVIVTCENFKENPDSCSGFTLGKNSPHYHLCCAGIPKASRLYSKLLKKAKEEENSNSNIMEEENKKNGKDFAEEDVINDFFCRSCDVEGSSRYLMEYFMNFHHVKVAYYGDEECVDAIAPVGFDELYRTNPTLELQPPQLKLTDMGRGFVKYLIQCEQKGSFRRKYKKSELRLDLIQEIVKRVHQKCKYQDLATAHTSPPLDASILVGQSIRLYCYIDNTYHTGRIIDWRQNTERDLSRLTFAGRVNAHKKIIPEIDEEVKKMALRKALDLDNEIARTQYLVRFEGGVEDRKVPVHQWLYLEEHPVMVAVSLNWTNIGAYVKRKRRKGSKRTKFRPAQFFVRSALEMAPVPEINENGLDAELLEVLNIFLCRDARSVIHSLKKIDSFPSWIDEEKETDDSNMNDVTPTGKTFGEKDVEDDESSSIAKYAAVDFLNPPDDFEMYLESVDGGADEPLVVAITLACYETEAINRVREGLTARKGAEVIT